MAITSAITTAGLLTALKVAAGVATVAGAATSTAITAKNAHDQRKAARQAQEEAARNKFDAKAEKQKAAMQAAEANRKRVLTETDTVQTTALGNANATQTQKKTLLGG